MILSDNMKGAALMAASMACFTINDAAMKALSDDVPLFQAMFLRGAGTTCLMLVLMRVLGQRRARLSPRDRRIVMFRNAAEIGAAYFFLTAIFNMPLANASAIMQALPLTITLAGALFLGEAVGWRRWSAIVVGFCGVMLVVRPGAAGFTWISVYPMAAVILVTVRDLMARRLSPDVPSMSVALSNAIAVTVFFGAGSLFVDWAPLTPASGVQLATAATLIVGGYLFSVSAMRVGEVAVISPFRYTSLLWALALGVILFGDWPDGWTLAGAAIVVATGAYTYWRERGLERAAVKALRPR